VPVSGQLTAVIEDLASAQARLRTLHAALPCHAWSRRPTPDRWSPAECVAHLNLTSETLLPLLRAGLQQARDRRGPAASRYRRDPVGWLIWKLVSPSGRLKTSTVPAFVPRGPQPADSLMSEFERLQGEVVSCAREAAGLPIDRVKLVSPFDARVKYNLYAALTLVPRHQHRHLLQAERAGQVCAPFASALTV